MKFNLKQNVNNQIGMFLKELKIKELKNKINNKNYVKQAINKMVNKV